MSFLLVFCSPFTRLNAVSCVSICRLQHDTTRSFFMTVEAPDTIRRGEQIGLRLDIFSNWDQDMEVCIYICSSFSPK